MSRDPLQLSRGATRIISSRNFSSNINKKYHHNSFRIRILNWSMDFHVRRGRQVFSQVFSATCCRQKISHWEAKGGVPSLDSDWQSTLFASTSFLSESTYLQYFRTHQLCVTMLLSGPMEASDSPRPSVLFGPADHMIGSQTPHTHRHTDTHCRTSLQVVFL